MTSLTLFKCTYLEILTDPHWNVPEEVTFEVRPNLSRDGFSEVTDRKCNSLLPGIFRVLLWGVMDFFTFIIIKKMELWNWKCFFFQKSRNDSKLGKVYEEKIEMYNSYYKKDTVCNVPRTSTTHTGCLRWKVPILSIVLILSQLCFFFCILSLKLAHFLLSKKDL